MGHFLCRKLLVDHQNLWGSHWRVTRIPAVLFVDWVRMFVHCIYPGVNQHRRGKSIGFPGNELQMVDFLSSYVGLQQGITHTRVIRFLNHMFDCILLFKYACPLF
jgi:hypothetical protein